MDHPFFILLNEIFALGPLQSSSSSVCSCHHFTHHHKNHKHKKNLKFSEFLKLTPIQDPHKWQLFQKGNDMIYGREKGRFPRHLRPVHRSKVIELLSDTRSSRYFLQSVFRSSSGLQLVPENLQSLGPILSLVLLSLMLPPHE